MPTQDKRAGRGCFFYGCLTLALLVLGGGIVAFFATKYAIRKLLVTYTEPQPATLPQTRISPGDLQQLQQRIKDFNDALTPRAPSATLTLTGDDLNALLGQTPDLKKYGDQFYLSIEGNELKARFSVPLEQLGVGLLKGRYLNGTADLVPALENGALVVRFRKLEINGKPLPAAIWRIIKDENLARDANANPDFANKLRQAESLEVKDGKLQIKVKAQSPEAERPI